MLRVVVRAELTTAIADLCLTDLGKPTAVLESLDGPMSERRPESATAAGTSRAAPST